MRGLGRQTIKVVRAPLRTDSHNNQTPDWPAASRTPVGGCDVQPGTTQEDLVNRDEVLIAWTVYAPLDTDVLATDRIEYRGVDYSVVGEPGRWESPSGQLDYTEIALQKWEG